MTVLAAAIVAVVIVVSGSGGNAGQPRATTSASASASRAATGHPGSASTTTSRSQTASRPRAEPATGPFRVGIIPVPIVEPSSAAAANGRTASGAPARLLPTMVRYPARGTPGPTSAPAARPASAAGPFPLIVFSQGYDVHAESYAWLLDAWARAGFVVADPTYPFTDPSTPGGVNETDIVNHPADLRFTISALEAQARDPASPLHGLVNPSEVAIIGHSDGGDVTAAVAANSCCSDPRVKAAVILSGAELASFGGTYSSGRAVPLMVVQGDADTINVPGCSVGIYNQAHPPKYFVDLPGSEHEQPYLDPGALRSHIAQGVVDFLRLSLQHQRSRLAALRRVATLPGQMSITTAASLARSTYCPGA